MANLNAIQKNNVQTNNKPKLEDYLANAVVGNIDLTKYQGVFFEVVRLENSFQKNCLISTATYGINEGNEFKILNQCKTKDGKEKKATAIAIPTKNPADENRALIVNFNFFTQILNLFYDYNYYVYYINKTYDLSIVGIQDRSYLWILVKNPEKHDVDTLLKLAQHYGFDTSKNIIISKP